MAAPPLNPHPIRSLRTRFQGSTVLVVAHRLNTIMDSDLVVVLEAGRIVESGSPAELLARPEGAFRTLFDAQGGGAH
jgi:ABC-type multidrug transport system fused ATPase/permease subunit